MICEYYSNEIVFFKNEARPSQFVQYMRLFYAWMSDRDCSTYHVTNRARVSCPFDQRIRKMLFLEKRINNRRFFGNFIARSKDFLPLSYLAREYGRVGSIVRSATFIVVLSNVEIIDRFVSLDKKVENVLHYGVLDSFFFFVVQPNIKIKRKDAHIAKRLGHNRMLEVKLWMLRTIFVIKCHRSFQVMNGL